MSQNYDPYESQYAWGVPAGQGYGYGSEPPPPPRRGRRRALAVTAVGALVAGGITGGLIGGLGGSTADTVTATSKTALSASQIASRVDPALVDIVSTDGYQGASSAGTGIVLTSDGEVLTNNHVAEGATSIKATDVGNGRTYTAKVVGYDASHDVAVLQLQGASGLTTASIGSSSTVTAGDKVTGLGNAGGKGGTPSVASGTVTALNQSITASDELSGTSERLTGLIQTNANIQPGDSGGALVNSFGQVIGMNTAASSGYQFQAMTGQEQAYAIPINEALSIASQIEKGVSSGDVHIGATAFLGVGLSGSQSGFGGFGNGNGNGNSGAVVGQVVSGSPAAKAGLTEGDEITSIGGQQVSAAEDVAHALVKHHPGDSVSVTWLDQTGQSHTANVTLATGPTA
jgi:S1-C subfamily serine protease